MLLGISTKTLLKTGFAAGLLSPIVVTIQALTRDGFDLAIHPLSMLSLGDLGWIQIANFIVSGFLFIAFAVGLRRATSSQRGGLWGPLLVGVYGVVLVAAGIFTVDPMHGFPPGTPPGLPETLSWHAMVHNVTFLLAFMGMICAQFIFARHFLSRGQKTFAVGSLGVGIITPVLIVASQALPERAGYILYAMGLLVDLWVVLLAAITLSNSSGRMEAGVPLASLGCSRRHPGVNG